MTDRLMSSHWCCRLGETAAAHLVAKGRTGAGCTS
jgi:hypothetical protein